MSDAQSIFLILLGFYFFECMKWAPLGACALVSGWLKRDMWTPNAPLVQFFGCKKSMFLAPLIPGSRVFLVTEVTCGVAHRNCSVRTGLAVRERLQELCKKSFGLRAWSAVVFAVYFVYSPFVYQRYGEGSYLYGGVAIGYMAQLCVALAYNTLHRNLFPKERGRRWLHTFYSMLLPWHAMRASDEIFIQYAKDWSEVAILGAFSEAGPARAQLASYWRRAKYLQSPQYSVEVLAPILREANISEGQAMAIAKPKLGDKYCPCCGTHYETSIVQCVDCRGVDLLLSD